MPDSAHDGPRGPNHLIGQTSPYLLQHLYNPVDWHPWGEEALNRARDEDKPIFLSIGYAACHWCHVMERESFEDPGIAAILNERFVPIKVDREERPDVDEIYMSAVQLLTGQGGWPLNVFLTPELEPFYGGTYFPPDGRYGRASFRDVLVRVDEVWRLRRDEVARSAAEITDRVRTIATSGIEPSSERPVGRPEIAGAAAQFAARFDAKWGGFGPAPKFPPHGALRLLLREHDRSGESPTLAMVRTTLDRMALGGMYDQIGGGFSRYSTDERWLVPHFEKMLYDQALLVPVYADAWLVTAEPLYRRVVEETLDFVRRELTHPDGGLWSSLDADSEGEEGRFYVWTPDEIARALGREDGELFCRLYGITAEGNFEGKNIPCLLDDRPDDATMERVAPLRRRLLEARAARARPATDDKVLAAWNGLMIGAFARAYQTFGRDEDLDAARRAAAFVLERLVRNGRLLASWRENRADLPAYLDDHAFLARGLLDLYESDFDRRWLDASASIARTMVDRFADRDHGGFWFTADDHERLLVRTRSLHDGALPSGSGVASEALLRLAVHLDDEDFRRFADRTLVAYREAVESVPAAFAALLVAADFAEGPVHEIAIVGEPDDAGTRSLLAAVRGRYLPNRAIALGRPGASSEDLPLLAGKRGLDGAPAAYVCRDSTCRAPTRDPRTLAASLEP